MAFLGKPFWGSANEHVTHSVLAATQQRVANCLRCWPQDKHQIIHASSLLKHVVVLSKSEGQQKWLAPCGTDAHRIARTIGVCILEQESLRQTEMTM
jgi:hypothetical protein